MPRDSLQLQLVGLALVRFGVIQHALAEHTGLQRERHKSQCPNPLPTQDLLVPRQAFILPRIRHNDGFGILRAPRPWQIPVTCFTLVFKREMPRSLEPDHAIIVEQQNRRAIRGRSVQQTQSAASYTSSSVLPGLGTL